MQPEPTEASTDVHPQINASELSNASHHGFLPAHLHPADIRDPLEEERVESPDPGPPADVAESGSREDTSLPAEFRRLRLDQGVENKPKASFQRISEYENALSPSPPRKQSEGPGFKVIKHKGKNAFDGTEFEKFPNEVLTHILSHLPAASLSAVSLVSRRFYSLVTTPHAWRTAFSRFFPGQDAIDAPILPNRRGSDQEDREQLRSERRLFTRLTGLASWRSEYILRTRLLRSLARGKPAQLAPGHGASSRSNSAANNANAVVTYSSQLFATVNHIHAVFSNGKKSPRFIHGTDETGTACTSDPNIGRIDSWGLSDPQALPQFADLFVGDPQYGAGDGPAGLPNSMDLSQPFGMIYGEGFPGGQSYFRSSEEMRGRFLSQPHVDLVAYDAGIPKIPALTEAVSAVWIAKSGSVLHATDGLIGMLTGSTLGIVTAHSLGAETLNGRRIGRGQLTAKWVLSPGVPIVAIKVDDSYDSKRKVAGRIWAVALNALGEVYYLTETPSSGLIDGSHVDNETGRHAWSAGRTAYWNLVESSRRVAKDDPYQEVEIHGSYSPRSSSKKTNLSRTQIVAETMEIEKFLGYRPAHFQKLCEGWDMRRRLEVDFAGDDGNGVGEGIFVIKCGVEEEQAEIRRFTRWKSEQASLEEYPLPKTPPLAPRATTMASLFGGGTVISPPRNASPERTQRSSLFGGSTVTTPARKSSHDRSPSTPSSPAFKTVSTTLVEEWRSSILSVKDHPSVEITTSAIDMSIYATLTIAEDPLSTVNGESNFSSPFATPSDQATVSGSHIPGHRARFLAVGTKTGVVIMWNMRGPQSPNAALVNELHPLRTIYTDSPQISCLAVSALYIVHGGNDGLVQSWDPLASNLQPIRTLNSRFSSRARRRLVQAEASIQGVGINLYAAGAIMIDPDPTVLRGMVSLGTHLRFWSYSSSSADQYQSKKRRLRRSGERGSNGGPDRFTNTGRGALMDYIATEQEELKKEKLRRSREEARLRGRFGVGLGGLSEEEALRYAEMVSAEAFQKDEERRMGDTGYLADANEGSATQSVWTSSATVTPEGSVKGTIGSPPKYKMDDEFEHDLEEAIRLSLLDGVDEGGRSPRASGSGEYEIPITYKQKKSRRSASSSPSTSQASKNRVKAKGSGSKKTEPIAADDLDFALQLSLAEAKSRTENESPVEEHQVDEFPILEVPEVAGKGKGRAS
ncbi:putative F-box/WD repeat-containing protein pof10 [Hyaloscypha finlandica]|nr:putative F-box/WD repeat-containing protein pof10 [Hyaloscypha finlandica]